MISRRVISFGIRCLGTTRGRSGRLLFSATANRRSISSVSSNKNGTTTNPLTRTVNEFTSTVRSMATTEQKKTNEMYEKKTPVEHVLLRPDTYIGSTEFTTVSQWVPVHSKKKDGGSDSEVHMKLKEDCTYVPGLFKIFDEILVNAADNKQRSTDMTFIKVEVDAKAGTISITNDGRGIPVRKHTVEDCYVPELVLGQLLTGSNFDDSVAKVTGGRNGYGAKLANIFSKRFEIDTVDSKRGLRYVQTWTDNMHTCNAPQLTPVDKTATDYTKISFEPDLEKFGMKTLKETDILQLFERRAYDVAGCNDSLKVYYNNKLLPNAFEDYLNLYGFNNPSRFAKQQMASEPDVAPSEDGEERKQTFGRIFRRVNNRWQIGFGLNTSGQFTHLSFVNSIYTRRGGTHVTYIADQLANRVLDIILKDHKDLKLTVFHIKNHLSVYINCLIENPSFDSQTKETLMTKPSNFGSKCRLTGPFLQDIIDQTGIVQYIVSWAKWRQQSELMSKARQFQGRRLTIPKLYDANWAGGPRSQQCTLILTEGDSAKALAVAGLPVLGRDSYGVFPLRGKLLNVRTATHDQLLNNAEINHLLAIIGLHYDRTYDTEEQLAQLRYGRVMLMVDQDHDGSHIKGLFINFIEKNWPNLLRSNRFLVEFVTPIVKAARKSSSSSSSDGTASVDEQTELEENLFQAAASAPTKAKRHNVLTFFTLREYQSWKENLELSERKRWNIKYYKGLGTSTPQEAKEYFADLKKHVIRFEWDADDHSTSEAVQLAFRKENADGRKAWLRQYDASQFVDHSKKSLLYSEFFNKELISFSWADNVRSIPSLVDGLKPGQRKVLYACFKRRLRNEIKVAQLAGYVSEQTAYHHGEVSLHSTIINMAQNFVGANNLPLLVASGQFGTRLQGGKDAASARYLFTRLPNYARHIFPEDDDSLLDYLDDDGIPVEPKHFVPIIPMILVNGAEGLGTGWSTSIPKYNPLEIIDNLIARLSGSTGQFNDMAPFYSGFKGTIAKKSKINYVTKGNVQVVDENTLVIDELPVKVWIDDYKEFLDGLQKTNTPVDKPLVKSYLMQHMTNGNVRFEVTLRGRRLESLQKIGLHKKFNLESSISLNNMHLFDHEGNLQRYDSPLQVMEQFYDIRLDLYSKRKQHMVEALNSELAVLTNRARFCEMVANREIDVINVSKSELVARLHELSFQPDAEDRSGFDYLLSMPVVQLTMERRERLLTDKQAKRDALTQLQQTTEQALWLSELQRLRHSVESYYKQMKLLAKK